MWLLQEEREPVNSMSKGPGLPFFGYKVSSLIKSDVVLNTVVVDKEFCKSINDSFGRSIVHREGKSVSRFILIFILV